MSRPAVAAPRTPALGITLFTLLLATAFGAEGARAQVTLFVTPEDGLGQILRPGSPLQPGDELVLDVTARNDGTAINGLGASAVGYDPATLAFRTGTTVEFLFAGFCIPGDTCFGALDGSGIASGPLVERDLAGTDHVRFFNHIALPSSTFTGEDDPDVDGGVGGPQARLIFDILAPTIFRQDLTVEVGAFAALGDALILPGGSLGVVETVWVVPEPGTALLLGLGLSILSRRRRQA